MKRDVSQVHVSLQNATAHLERRSLENENHEKWIRQQAREELLLELTTPHQDFPVFGCPPCLLDYDFFGKVLAVLEYLGLLK